MFNISNYDLFQNNKINNNNSVISTINTNISILSGSVIYLTEEQNITNKQYRFSETMGTNLTGSGIVVYHTVGENFAFGEIGYFKSDGKVWRADANQAGFFPCPVIALETITTNNSGLFLKLGTIRNDAWNWTIGGIIYLSTNIGEMTQTQPSTTDDAIVVLGIAFPNADTIQFQPQLIYLTRA